MLETNLSTRPFYNVRAVHVALGAAGVLVLALIIFDVVQIVNLTVSHQALGARAVEAEQQAERLRAEAVRTRAQIDPQELQLVADAAREANEIIDRRAFSWTELFGRLETTLPSDVRITAVQPTLGRDGSFIVGVGVEARRAEDLDAFIEALETSGAFHDVLATQNQTSVEGLIEATVEAAYVPSARDEADGAPATPASSSGDGGQ